MTRNWQNIFQSGQGMSETAVAQLSGIEVDLATLLAGPGAGSVSAATDVVITSKTGDVSGDIIFKTGSAATERLRIKQADGSLLWPSGNALYNISGTSSQHVFQVAGGNTVSIGNTYVNVNYPIIIRGQTTAGVVIRQSMLNFDNNADGGGDTIKWQMGLDVANSPFNDDFFLARGTPGGSGSVQDIIYLHDFDATAAGAKVAVGINVTPPSASSLHVSGNIAGTADPTVIISSRTSQTGNLLSLTSSSAATELFGFTVAGLPKWTAAGNQQTTVGSAGGASAPPATPTKYLKVVDSSGTTLVIPAYAAA